MRYVSGYRLPGLLTADGREKAMNADLARMGRHDLISERARLCFALAKAGRDAGRNVETPAGCVRFCDWATRRVCLIDERLAGRR